MTKVILTNVMVVDILRISVADIRFVSVRTCHNRSAAGIKSILTGIACQQRISFTLIFRNGIYAGRQPHIIPILMSMALMCSLKILQDNSCGSIFIIFGAIRQRRRISADFNNITFAVFDREFQIVPQCFGIVTIQIRILNIKVFVDLQISPLTHIPECDCEITVYTAIFIFFTSINGVRFGHGYRCNTIAIRVRRSFYFIEGLIVGCIAADQFFHRELGTIGHIYEFFLMVIRGSFTNQSKFSTVLRIT